MPIPKTYRGKTSEIFSADLYGMSKRVLGTVKVTFVRHLLYLCLYPDFIVPKILYLYRSSDSQRI